MSVSLAWILIGTLIAALAVLGFRGARDSHIKKWEETYGVTLDRDDETIVERRLTHVRRARTLGAIVGFIGVSSLDSGNAEVIWLQPLFGAGAGYLAAAVLTEITLKPLLRPPMAGASLVPRTFTAYLPRYAAVVLMAIPLLAAGLITPYASLFRRNRTPIFPPSRPSSRSPRASRPSHSSRPSVCSPPSGGPSRSPVLTSSLLTTRFAPRLSMRSLALRSLWS